MRIDEALNLIKHEKLSSHNPAVWADLGCGSGTFTLALAEILTEESLIYAIDSNRNSLKQIPQKHDNVKIDKINADFTDFPLPQTDGIMLANSLHFIAEKEPFIKKIIPHSGIFLIVEYETAFPNPYVPFPVEFSSLKDLFQGCKVSQIGKRNSIYNNGKIYSAIIEKNICPD